MEEFIANVPTNAKFLYSAFYAFTNQDLLALLNRLGLKTKVERGNRVFPASDKSSDVIKALEKHLENNNVQRLTGEADGIITENNKIAAVRLKDGNMLPCHSVIVATGGLSYPATGSTGDGYRLPKNWATPLYHQAISCSAGNYGRLAQAGQGLFSEYFHNHYRQA